MQSVEQDPQGLDAFDVSSQAFWGTSDYLETSTIEFVG
jgi:hypothetical protein